MSMMRYIRPLKPWLHYIVALMGAYCIITTVATILYIFTT